jgi:glycosyltransferase involved in cell wall biosynthesis
MRVAVRPSFVPGRSGGVEQYVQGLASALGRLEGPDRYDVVGTALQRQVIEPYVHGASSWVSLPGTPRDLMRRVGASPLGPSLRRLVEWVRPMPATLPGSPEQVEDGGYDVVHFAAQGGELTALPNLYQPWDLQHLHFPQLFTESNLAYRDVVWGPCCQRAAYVVVASEFVRTDVIDSYGVDPGRVAVVAPGAPSLPATSRPRRDEAAPFALFPAQTWAHKNHIRLIDAVALLKGRGTPVRLVCTGQRNERDATVRRHAEQHGVTDLVELRGYVDDSTLADLYARARCVVFPSLFEGFGFPVLEAFNAGVAVTCSNTTSLPELAGDAALLFDPTDIEAIADALGRLWDDPALRTDLETRGAARAQGYTWDHLAQSCRALYRAAAGRDLEVDDRALLDRAGVTA